jgi:hypothetical protein
MLEDFYHTGKIQRLRPGLNPRTRVPEISMLTTRPPKPSTCSLVEAVGGLWGPAAFTFNAIPEEGSSNYGGIIDNCPPTDTFSLSALKIINSHP